MFYKSAIISSLAFVAAVCAIPLEERASTTYDANYEDLLVLPAAALTPITTYKGLSYDAFVVITQGVAGIYTTGLKAHSNFNVAGYGVYSKLLSGTGVPTVTSQSGTFDLKSQYYGCVVNSAESALSVPTACTITATGSKANGKTVTQNFSFTPNGVLSDMQKVTFNRDFNGLTKVTFSTANSLLLGTLFDDLVYTIKN